MFRDDDDRRYFKSLLERYLDPRGNDGPHANYRDRVELWSLTIKTNHYHLVLRQLVPGGVGALMRAVLALYVRHFNRKYGDAGAMFSGEVRFRPAATRRDILNAIAYVHENHGDHCFCEFCTHWLYVGHPAHVPGWVSVAVALKCVGGVGRYSDWLFLRRQMRVVAGEPEAR